MTAPELKPCPFCGGEASISEDHDQDGSGAFYAVKCHKCRAKSPEIYALETCNIHFAQVRDAWNRRADLAAVQPAQVKPDCCDICRGGTFAETSDGKGWRCVECKAIWLRAALDPQPDPRDEVIARLVEENNWQIKARAQHWLRRTISASEDAAVEEICEKYGYGAVMDAASRLWARKPYGSGAFYVGGCIGFKSDDEARAALAAAKAVL